MDSTQEINYKDTLNLPLTDFPMKGNGPVRELDFQKRWDDLNIYEKCVEKRKNSERFFLHDGPPYLSSDKIHIGTALNKILKDIIVKYKTLRGYYSPYIPGYDCHGLPIENAVLKTENVSKDKLSPIELRNKCSEFALSNRVGQENKFKRLGVLGDWTNAYMTLNPKFEAKQLELFGEMLDKGYIYRGLKAVYWSTGCQTALAEAEVEYVDNYKSPSIFVAFPFVEYSSNASSLTKFSDLRVVIWTTTPWTIPGNLAICLNESYDYVVVKSIKFGHLLLADGLLKQFSEKIGEELVVLHSIKGKLLEGSNTKHPLYNRYSPIILGLHVTLDAGTGCVHTAPGHGMDDFIIGQKYGLDILSPVDAKGCYTAEAGSDLVGLHVQKEGNNAIISKLTDSSALILKEDYFHSYPHCWRSKTPIIFRATEQWFSSVDKYRSIALSEINKVNWIPSTGKNRIYAMVENRSDWCISRQRTWGVPIPAFYYYENNDTNTEKKLLANKEIIMHIANIVANQGCNAWWTLDVKDLLPESHKVYADKYNLIKEMDTMDVWFDSGSTHRSVVENAGFKLPVELYLEGSDQHRGWFQSSLLTSVATNGIAPYKSVLTHGFVVDEHGRKMSKSVGNVVDPDKVIFQYGADILRLWVASVDYSVDIKVGDNLFKQLSEVYRNIRNTIRFLLGNLNDFNPANDAVSYDDLWNIDKFALHKLELVKVDVTQCMDDYHFFKYYQILQNFCSVDLSSFYFDLNKDRLYTSGRKSISRRAVQTVLYEHLITIIPMLVPVLPHLAEDAWINLPNQIRNDVPSALLLDWKPANSKLLNTKLLEDMKKILSFKIDAYKALEESRQNKKIGKSVETKLLINFKPNSSNFLLAYADELPTILIVSQIEFSESAPLEYLSKFENDFYVIYVLNADGNKCPRCWKHSSEIGLDSKHPIVCKPCADAVENRD